MTKDEASPGDTAVPVLIVDDDPNIRLVMEEVLARDGRKLVFANSGEDALRILRHLTPAAILLDVHMGGMSGFETAKLIRGRSRLASTPIVFMTGVSTDELAMEQGYSLGAVDYLLKPIIPEVLESKVEAFCTLARQRQELEDRWDKLAVTEMHLEEANAALAHLASTDTLTGLKNRSEFDSVLAGTADRASRAGQSYAIVMIDLDGFKQVNDTWGHLVGDQVLAEVGRRIQASTRSPDAAFRLGGDEFCLLIPGIAQGPDISSFAYRLAESLRRPHTLAPETEVVVPGSIGIAIFEPDHPQAAQALLSRADAAMYAAKADHSGCRIDRTDAGSDSEAVAMRELARQRRTAAIVAAARESLRFRPVVDVETGCVVGLDALAWGAATPNGDESDPGADHPEDADSVAMANRAIFGAALNSWNSPPQPTPGCRRPFLGLSATQCLWVGPDLTELISSRVEHGAVAADDIVLWLDESAFPLLPAGLTNALRDLGRLGVRIGIDHVGTALPLIALGQLPVALLRIDPAMLDTRNSKALACTVGLAAAGGLFLVGADVSTPDQLELLRQSGYTLAQGDLLGKPSPTMNAAVNATGDAALAAGFTAGQQPIASSQ